MREETQRRTKKSTLRNGEVFKRQQNDNYTQFDFYSNIYGRDSFMLHNNLPGFLHFLLSLLNFTSAQCSKQTDIPYAIFLTGFCSISWLFFSSWFQVTEDNRKIT